jgi:hypothetical protein
MQYVQAKPRYGLTISLVAASLALLLTSLNAAAETNSLTIAIGAYYTHTSGVTGSVGDAFTLQEFSVQDGQLVAVGQLSFSLCILGVDPKNCLASVEQTIALPITDITGTCEQVQITLGSIDVLDPSLPDYTIHLSPSVFDFAAQPESPRQLQSLLCAIVRRSTTRAPLHSMGPLLNQMIGLLH